MIAKMQHVNVGVIGLGNVGSGTLAVLADNADQIALKLGFKLRVTAVCSRSVEAKKLPESLDALAPEFLEELPEDPFTGDDLRYERRDKGYIIYSVGRDRKDDHGLEEANKKKSVDGKSYDLTFLVLR